MFAHVLAVLLGLGSVVFYLAAFFYPEVHRRSDFLWGGLGLLYAAVLWLGAEQMTGLVLLGQTVAIALLLGLGWQTLTVRREKTPIYQQTPIALTPEVVGGWAKSKLNQLRIAPDETVRSVKLERRVVEGPAALNGRLDPRRRPAYDYEFVEDGVALDEMSASDLAGFGLAETFEATHDEAEGVEALDCTAPPSAEAKVIAEVRPEVLGSEDDLAEVDEAEGSGLEVGDAEFERLDADGFSADSAEVDSFETDDSEVIDSETGLDEETAFEETVSSNDDSADVDREALEPVIFAESEYGSTAGEVAVLGAQVSDVLAEGVGDRPSEIVSDESDDSDWAEDDTDWITESDDPETGDPLDRRSVSKENSAKEKPSLLAIPLILVGWMKDVVVSMTKPKPSKPMIEIPRRASPIEAMQSASSAPIPEQRVVRQPEVTERDIASAPSVTIPTSVQADSGFDAEPTAEPEPVDWEESNWDD